MHKSVIALLAGVLTHLAAAEPAAAPVFARGDSISAEALPTEWIRGTPVKTFDKGLVYIITFWNTRSPFKYGPDNQLQKIMPELTRNPKLRALVILSMDDRPRDKMERFLNFPSQQTTLPIGLALTEQDPANRLWGSRIGSGDKVPFNTMVVRDGTLLWVGEGCELQPEALRAYSVPDFDLARFQKQEEADRQRNGQIMKQLFTAYPEARKNKDEQAAAAILDNVAKEPDLPIFAFMTLQEIRTTLAAKKHDIPAALAELEKMSARAPEDFKIQSRVYKIITAITELREPGRPLAARVCRLAAAQMSGDSASAWLRSAGDVELEMDHTAAALADYEAAEKLSPAFTALESYRNGKAAPACP